MKKGKENIGMVSMFLIGHFKKQNVILHISLVQLSYLIGSVF